jgi:predicted ATPase
MGTVHLRELKEKEMLKSWWIKNFKPIVDSGELQLMPVTVLAGRNSSGKSSLLQSILMIAQTLGSRLLDRPLLPNERLVQLGTFEDILSEIGHSRMLELKFGLEMEDEEALVPSRRTLGRWGITSAQLSVEFSGAAGNGRISSAIEASKVVVEHVSLEANAKLKNRLSQTSSELQSHKISFDLQRMGDDELRRFLENVSPDQRGLLAGISEHDSYSGTLERTNETVQQRAEDKSERYLITLAHFLPARFVRKYNPGIRQKQFMERSLRLAFGSDRRIALAEIERVPKFNTASPLPSTLKVALDGLCKKYGITLVFSGQTLRDLMNWMGEIGRTNRKVKIFVEIQEVVIQELLGNISDEQNVEGLEFVLDPSLEDMEQVIGQVTAFFASRIRYLGPLRADPQASQKFGPSSELDDVGSKGEFAAAVYDSNRDARITWYNPQNKQIEEGRLREALDCWTQYLGVAQQVQTEMAGLSGVAWKIIARKGRKPRSLPEVGVGVSQILPLLIMGLLSPANSLLIIEQPELHLHPYIQARLGDFFMGLAKCKKQCLIETHSENLVSQLRLHIVEAGGLEKSDCAVYFVDQDERGAATFAKIEISPDGNILNWPDGFFDETMLQEDRITSASVRRRAREAKHGS